MSWPPQLTSHGPSTCRGAARWGPFHREPGAFRKLGHPSRVGPVHVGLEPWPTRPRRVSASDAGPPAGVRSGRSPDRGGEEVLGPTPASSVAELCVEKDLSSP